MQRYLVADRYDLVVQKTTEILVGLDEIDLILKDKAPTDDKAKERYAQMKSEIDLLFMS